jgi:hypothetical protein
VIHPDTARHRVSDVVGDGVVATRPIPRGTLTWVRDPLDAGWPLEEVRSWPEAYRDIVFRTCLRVGDEVIQLWDHGRYVNHSCEPNCGGTERGLEVALRDIEAGEQLTNDYATFSLPDDPPFLCACGAATCRGERLYRPSAADRERLRHAVADALRWVDFVPQPLAPLRAQGTVGR